MYDKIHHKLKKKKKKKKIKKKNHGLPYKFEIPLDIRFLNYYMWKLITWTVLDLH